MAKAARHTELLQALVTALEEKRTDQNAHQINYITYYINKGWSERQLLARLKQMREADEWQAKHGNPQYRQAHQSNVELFDFVSEFLNQQAQA